MREINLSRIRPEKRKQAWERLQRKYPAHAALVKTDMVQQIRAAFDAEIILLLPDEEKKK